MKVMKKIKYYGVLLAVSGLVACGGGSGPQAIAIDGIAATGAPMASASVSVFDATGSLVVEGIVVGPDGKYNLTIPAGKVAPYVFVVDDGVDKLVSVLGSNSSTTVNINQITDLVAAKLSPSGNPLSLSSEITNGSATATTSVITSASNVVQTALQPLLTAANVSNFDPFSVKFSTNGTGVDKVLDMLDIKITPAGATSNVEVTVKGAMDEDKGANSLSQFALGATAPTAIPALPAVPAGDVVADGTSPLIKNLLDKMTACYALSIFDRVGATGTTAENVVATPCKEIFINQNPVEYKHGGSLVSSTQHFSSIFNPAAVGVVFDRPQYFGTVKSDAPGDIGPRAGDMLIGYRWVDTYGNYQYERVMVRKNAVNGRLEVVGNQYLHDGGVGSYAQKRTNVRNDAMSYYSVGYIPVALVYWTNSGTVARVVGSGKAINNLSVTSPSGRNFLLCPQSGYSFMVFAKDPTIACTAAGQSLGGTNFARLRSEYLNNTTSTHPRTKDTSLAFASIDYTDAELEAQVSTKPWTFVYNFADNTTAIQYHRPARRAYSIREFKAVPLPILTTARLETLKASLSQTTTPGKGYGDLPTSGFQLAWQGAYDDLIAAKKPVPANAAPMTAVRIFGGRGLTANGFSGSFEDRVSIRSNLRSFTITCPSGDPQCAPGTSQYASTSKVSGTDLYSRSSDGVEYVNFYSLTFLSP
jgi:hypothetical protein